MERAHVMEQTLARALRAQQETQAKLDEAEDESEVQVLQEQLRVACHAASLMFDALAQREGAREEESAGEEGVRLKGEGGQGKAEAKEGEREKGGGMESLLREARRSAEQGVCGRKMAIELHSNIAKLQRRYGISIIMLRFC